MIKNYTDSKRDDQNVDIKKVIAIFSKFWYWYVISIVFIYAGAVLFVKFANPEYEVYSSVYIKENASAGSNAGREFMQNLNMFDYQSTFNNEILVLKSTPLIRQSIENLNFQVSYFGVAPIGMREIYSSSPFYVLYDAARYQPVDIDIHVGFEKNGALKINFSGEEVSLFNYNKKTVRSKKATIAVDKKANIGQSVDEDFCFFRLILKEGVSLEELDGKKYVFRFNNMDKLTNKIQNNLTVVPENAQVSIVAIRLKSSNHRKGTDFIEELTSLYLAKNLDRKNHMASNTIAYIDEQLAEVSDSLNYVESKLEDFRSSNQMINVTTKAGRVFEQLQQAEQEKMMLEREYKYYEYLDEYFGQSNDLADLVVPSSLGVNDQTLNQLIRELIAVVNQRNELIGKKQEKSPIVRNLEFQIENLKRPIQENIRYNKRSMERTLGDLGKNITKLKFEIEKLPKTERQFVNIERKFQLNDAIYTFLLERRAEAQIAKASNMPEHEVVEPAKLSSKVFPNKKIILVAAGFLSLMLPTIIIWLIVFFDDRIHGKSDIEKYSRMSFLGTVVKNPFKEENVVNNNPSSAISENFRTIRTNLTFMMKEGDKKVLLVSSCFSGEGKTFVSLNLASSLSLMGKRVVLVGFDLRKANPYGQYIKADKELGLTSYYLGDKDAKSICIPTDNKNLDIIPPGVVPPNPMELIGSDRTKALFDSLRAEYDVIVLDTPPIGVVSDGWLLMDQSDANLIVVREGLSKKSMLSNVLQEVNEKEVPNVGMLLNASRLRYRKYMNNYYTK